MGLERGRRVACEAVQLTNLPFTKMKTILLTTLIAICLPCVAQEPVSEKSTAARLVLEAPGDPILQQVAFEAPTLQEIVEFLEKKQTELSGAPLNVVLSPGLEKLIIPKMYLRNVTAREVLGITAKLLGLELEPVKGEGTNRTAAHLLKKPAPGPFEPQPNDPFATVATPSNQPVHSEASATPTADNLGKPGSGVEVIATAPLSSSLTKEETKVFFLEMALVKRGMDDNQRKGQLVQLEAMHDFITKVDPKSELTTCAELGLVTVKSTKMPIITQAIEALQTNSSKLANADATEELAKQKRQALDMEKRTAELQMELARKSRELDELKLKAAGKPGTSVDQ